MLRRSFHGLISYRDGLVQQQAALDELREKQVPTAVLLGFEHPAVVTLGVRGREDSDLKSSRIELNRANVDLFHVARGGQAMVHSPGQLVLYPCLNLRRLGLSPREFVCEMESITVDCLKGWDISAKRGLGEPGLFVGDRKIAAFGFSISRGFTSHGIAINIENDLSYFDLIRTCGVSRQPVTSLRNQLRLFTERPVPSLAEVFEHWVNHFSARLKLWTQDRDRRY